MNKLVAQTLAKKENGEKGFTLIELLVVVIIIGILAAIAIPIFLNMRQGAWRSSVESDVTNAVLVVEQATTAANGSVDDLVFTAGTGSYTVGTATDTLTGTLSDDVTLAITFDDALDTYTITGTHAELGTDDYVYTSATGSGTW